MTPLSLSLTAMYTTGDLMALVVIATWDFCHGNMKWAAGLHYTLLVTISWIDNLVVSFTNVMVLVNASISLLTFYSPLYPKLLHFTYLLCSISLTSAAPFRSQVMFYSTHLKTQPKICTTGFDLLYQQLSQNLVFKIIYEGWSLPQNISQSQEIFLKIYIFL